MDTSLSLLDSLKLQADGEAWERFVALYAPLIRGWLRRLGAAPSDLEDVVQEVLIVVFRRMPEFTKTSQTGALRSWLRTITAHCVRDFWKKKNKHGGAIGGSDFLNVVAQLEDPNSGLSTAWNRAHDRHVLQFLLEEIRPTVSETNWQAFSRFALEGQSADDVAQELGISTNAVFIAKSRVLSRLRQRGQGLID